MSSNDLTTSLTEYDFSFPDVTLTDGTTYYIKVTTDTTNGKVYVGSVNGDTYASGTILNNGSADGSRDLTFSVSHVENSAPSDLTVTATQSGGLSLNEDGGNDVYFVADDGGGLLGGLTSVTIETSFSISTPAINNTPLLSYADGSNDEELALFLLSDGSLEFTVHTDGSTFQRTTGNYTQLLDGEKHQVSVSWDSSNGAVVFYIDGILEESFTGYKTGQTITGGGQLVFGQEQDSELGGFSTNDIFSGTLYDMRIFNDVRTASEIASGYNQSLPNTEAGMIANWTFSDFSTTGVITDSVSGNNLTVGHVGGFTASTPVLTLRVQEGAANTTVIGSVAAADPDNGDTVTYSLQDDAGGRFSIDGTSGQITLTNTSLIDYATNTSHDITIRVTDSGGLTYDEVITVQVQQNNAPTDLKVTSTTGGGLNLNADGGNDTYLLADDGGAILGGLTTVTFETTFLTTGTEDTPGLISYATTIEDNEFAAYVHDTNGTIVINIGGNYVDTGYDFSNVEVNTVHTLSITWSSIGGTWELYIDGNKVAGNTGLSSGHTIATGGKLIFGNEQDQFGGDLSVNQELTGTLYDTRIFNVVRSSAEILANYNQTLPNTESGLIANWTFNDMSTSGVITDTVSNNNLTVQHVDGFTASTPGLTLSVQENAVNNTVVGSVSATAPDNGESCTYTLQDNAGGRFAIGSSTGQIIVADGTLLDYESNTSHIISVRVADSNGLTYDETFTVLVTNIGPSPVATNDSATVYEATQSQLTL